MNPRPEHRAKVETWQRAYLDLAQQLEASGNPNEAREHRYLASECSRLLRVMDLLERAEAEGAWIPVYKVPGVGAKVWMRAGRRQAASDAEVQP